MLKREIQSVLIAATLILGWGAMAKETHSMKPGLWEFQTSMKSSNKEVNDAMEEMQAAMADMPEEQRKQMEAMMASQGVQMGDSNGKGMGRKMKVCITPEKAAKFDMQTDSNCAQQVTQNSGNKVKVKFSCKGDEPTSGEGQFTLKGDKAFSGTMAIDSISDGKKERMEMSYEGKWLSADCGNLTPQK